MKSFIVLSFLSLLLTSISAQNFKNNDNLDVLLKSACDADKKILIEFYTTTPHPISEVDKNFIRKYFVTSSVSVGGELSEVFSVKTNIYYILDRDGYKMMAVKPKNLMTNVGRLANSEPSECKINDIRADDSILKKRSESTTKSNKKTETIEVYEDDSYSLTHIGESYEDSGKVPDEELLELNGIEADFVVEMDNTTVVVEEKPIYTVQVDVFSTLDAAKKRAAIVKKNPLVTKEVFINQTHVDELGGVYYRVSTGKFSNETDCLEYQKTLFRKLKPEAKPNSKGWKDAIVKKINKTQIVN